MQCCGGRKSPRNNTERELLHICYMSDYSSSSDWRLRQARSEFGQSRGRQSRQQPQHNSQEGRRATSNLPVEAWKSESRWKESDAWVDYSKLRGASAPAHGSAQSASRAECPATRHRREASQQARSQASNLLSIVKAREAERQAEKRLSFATLEREAWRTKRDVWVNIHCPKELQQLAQFAIVPPEHWSKSYDELNELLGKGEFEKLLPSIFGCDSSTARKIQSKFSWFCENNCRLDQVNSEKTVWCHGRFAENPEEPGQYHWIPRGKVTVDGVLHSGNQCSRSHSPAPADVQNGTAAPKHAKDTWRGSIERGEREFELGDLVASRIEEILKARVDEQGRAPVQTIPVSAPSSTVVAPLALDSVPFHDHIKGGAPKVSSDLATTTFNPAPRKKRLPEDSGLDPSQNSSGSGVDPPAATEESPRQGRESRAASTASSFLIVERPPSAELDPRFREPRSPTGETDESTSEDTRAKACADLDERLEVKKTFECRIDGEFKKRLAERRTLVTGDSSDSSTDREDIDFGLPQGLDVAAPVVENHQLDAEDTPTNSPVVSPVVSPRETAVIRTSSRSPGVPSRKVPRTGDTPRSKEQISRELILQDELQKKEKRSTSEQALEDFREKYCDSQATEGRQRGRSLGGEPRLSGERGIFQKNGIFPPPADRQAHFDRIDREGLSIFVEPFPGEKRKQIEDTDTELTGPPLQAPKVGSGCHPPVLDTPVESPPGLSKKDRLAEEVLEWETDIQKKQFDYLPNQSGLLLQLEKQQVTLENEKALRKKETEELYIQLHLKNQEHIENAKEIKFLRDSLAKKSSEQAREEQRREIAVKAKAEAELNSAAAAINQALLEKFEYFEVLSKQVTDLHVQINELNKETKEIKATHEVSFERTLNAVKEQSSIFLASKLDRIDEGAEEELTQKDQNLALSYDQLKEHLEVIVERQKEITAREEWLYGQHCCHQAKAPPPCVIEEQKLARAAKNRQWKEEIEVLRARVESLRGGPKEKKVVTLEETAEEARVQIAILHEKLATATETAAKAELEIAKKASEALATPTSVLPLKAAAQSGGASSSWELPVKAPPQNNTKAPPGPPPPEKKSPPLIKAGPSSPPKYCTTGIQTEPKTRPPILGQDPPAKGQAPQPIVSPKQAAPKPAGPVVAKTTPPVPPPSRDPPLAQEAPHSLHTISAFVREAKSPSPKAYPPVVCHPSERTAFGANAAAVILEKRTSFASPIRFSARGYSDARNRTHYFLGTWDYASWAQPQHRAPLPHVLQPDTHQYPVEIILLRRNQADPRSEFSLWTAARKHYFNGHNFDNGDPIYSEHFDPRECPPRRFRERLSEVLDFVNKLQQEDRDFQYSKDDVYYNSLNPPGISHTFVDYRFWNLVSLDVHHTVDLVHTKVQIQENKARHQGPGYIPNETFPLVQTLINAGWQPFLNVSEHEGQKEQRESGRRRLANHLFLGKSYRFTSGVCPRPVPTFPGLAQVQCTVQTWKPAVCLAYGAPVHIDDKPQICERCDRAGIVPIYIKCEKSNSGNHENWWDRDVKFACGLRGYERHLTASSFEEAVQILCRLNASNELSKLVALAQAGAWDNPWSLNANEQGHLFDHLN